MKKFIILITCLLVFCFWIFTDKQTHANVKKKASALNQAGSKPWFRSRRELQEVEEKK